VIRRRTSEAGERAPDTADETPDVPEAKAAPAQAPKGRATPSRKEAEKARLETRRGVPSDPRQARRATRERRNDAAVRSRTALRTGDEAHYPARDQGPVRRFCRDYVDSRFRLSELLVVFYILVLVADIAGAGLGTLILGILVLVVILDVALTVVGVRRAVAKRFPDQPTNGITLYVLGRSIFPRRFRTPKPRIKRGEKF
jgi:hypothetical protein